MNDMQANPLSEMPGEDPLTQEARGKQSKWNFAGQSVRVLFLCTNNRARS